LNSRRCESPPGRRTCMRRAGPGFVQAGEDEDEDEEPGTPLLERGFSDHYELDCCHGRFKAARSDVRSGRLTLTCTVVLVGLALWVTTVVCSTLAVLHLKPEGGENDGEETTGEDSAFQVKAEIFAKDPTTGQPEFACPCSCQHGTSGLVPTPQLQIQSVVLPRPPTLPPLWTPTPLGTLAPPPTVRPVPVPKVPTPEESHAFQIQDGTLAVAKSDGPIFASTSSWSQIGTLKEGTLVAAAGPPEIADGYAMVPIKPHGAVEVAILKFQDQRWTCHDWDEDDRSQPDFNSVMKKPTICVQNRSDGFEYKWTYGNNRYSAPGCEENECWCCKRKKLQASEVQEGRRLQFTAGATTATAPYLGIPPPVVAAAAFNGVPWTALPTPPPPTPLAPSPLSSLLPPSGVVTVPAVAPPTMLNWPPLPASLPYEALTPPPPPLVPGWSMPLPPATPKPPAMPKPPATPAPLPTPAPVTYPKPLPLPPAVILPVEIAKPLPIHPITPAPYTPLPLPSLPLAGASSISTCSAGDTCSYGQTWCSKTTHEPMAPTGQCIKRKCDGPAGMATFPNHTCGNPSVPKLNITSELAGLPNYVRWVLSDIPWLNKIIEDAMIWHGLPDFTVELDEVLTQSFNWKLENSEARWLVGCWPPQRYIVTDGYVHFPSGRIILRIAGLNLVVSVYNLRVKFRRLRVELQCHGGVFYMGGVGQDNVGDPLTPERFEASGEVDVHCESSFSAFCISLLVSKKQLSEEVIERIPAILSGWLGGVDQLYLGKGCPEAMRNTLTVMPYTSKECCEAQFVTDRWGCLVGGQFNGRHQSLRKVVAGVECQPSKSDPGHWVAQCDTIPGNYEETSPGLCEEVNELPAGNCTGCSPGWLRTSQGIHLLCWADLFFTFALVWTSVASCCLGCSSGRFSQDRLEATLARLPRLPSGLRITPSTRHRMRSMRPGESGLLTNE